MQPWWHLFGMTDFLGGIIQTGAQQSSLRQRDRTEAANLVNEKRTLIFYKLI